jgi:hypothetical protein
MVFIPFHWGDQFSAGNAANYLTISAIGRVAKQPELKFCAVNLELAMPANHKVTEPPRRALRMAEAASNLPELDAPPVFQGS